MSARSRIRFAQYAFALTGLLALGYCAATWIGVKLYQNREARRFRQEAARHAAPPRSAAHAVPKDGAVLARIEIPRVGLAVMIVEGVKDGDLRRAVGHIPGTSLPGEPGNIGIAGHRDTFFRPLRLIRRDDRITLSTLKKAYLYRVVSTRVVGPDDVQVLYPTRRDILTLVTCFPFDYVGAAPKRFIVRAERLPSPANPFAPNGSAHRADCRPPGPLASRQAG